MSPGFPASRQRLPWSAEAARDRLSSTTFLAALFHGIVILGITFGADLPGARSSAHSMEVVLVTAEYERREPPPSAVLLAQQNLSGAGNADPGETLQTALGHPFRSATPGPAQGGSDSPVRPGDRNAPDRPPVLTAKASMRRLAESGEDARAARDRESSLPAVTSATELVGRLAAENVVPDDRPRELVISANTRESRIASYLNVWKRRVEQVGTLNFPRAAQLRGGGANPVLEVAIRADGSLQDVVLRTSSGQRGLDEAAMNILRMSAPFEPFPETLRGEYDVLRFAYEWRFSEGAGTVRAASGI